MADTSEGYSQSIPDMSQEEAPVPWKKFFVKVSGRDNGARYEFVNKLKDIGQTQVFSHEECEYILLFCPIASRVGTEVGDALKEVSGDKPVILVVMHHTFSADHIVADSNRLTKDNQNVRLTVDCLFYEGKFLKSTRNEIALGEIKKLLGVPVFRVSPFKGFYNCDWTRQNLFILIVVLIAVVLVVIVTCIVKFAKK